MSQAAPQGRFPSVTIVICARNARAHLRCSLPAALGQDYPADRFSVLVVDNGSTDGTAAFAREQGARVLSCRRRGVVFAREHGWRACRTEVAAYLDADCEPPTDWLRRLAPAFRQDARLGAIGGALVPGEVRTLAERHVVDAQILDTERTWSRNALQWPFLPTAALLIRRRALHHAGGFDTSLNRAGGEDADLCWRLRAVGWAVRYEREVRVRHHHRASLRAMLRQVYWYGQSSACLFARWRHELGWWRFTDWAPYRRVAGGLVRTPGAFLASAGYGRWRPLLQAADGAAFLAGKWRGAIRDGLLFF